MRISEYEKLENLVENVNVLLDSENTGTRSMFVQEFAKELVKFLGTNDLLGQIDLKELPELVNQTRETSVLLEENGKKYRTELFSLPFASADAHESDDGDSNSMPRRRNTIRQKNLGSSFTAEQLHEIETGRFRDMFVGDYWEINNIKWRIVDVDYWYGVGNHDRYRCWTHHLVIMPDSAFLANDDGTGFINNSVAGGYYGSPLRTYLQTNIKPKILNSIPENMILIHSGSMCNSVTNGVPSGSIAGDMSIEVPSMASIFGHMAMIPLTNYTEMAVGSADFDSRQFALFQNAPKQIIEMGYAENGNYGYRYRGYYLRDMAGSATAYVHDIFPSFVRTTDSSGTHFRPVFGLRAPATS